jgi:farnesyl-diphosphate farnesyltransferase
VAPVNFSALAKQQGLPAERELLEYCELSLACLRQLAPPDLERVVEVLNIIIGGQDQDLRRFAGASELEIVALQTEAELDDYTYRVAGCVGEFWTRMCRAHLFPKAMLGDTQFIADGVRFGKGLQLVNILRDLPVDLRKGRCYLPMSGLNQSGLNPGDLLSPASESKLRPLYNSLLDLAQAHLAVGWRYTNTIPPGQVRVRLACAWPILIGVRTLARLRREMVLDPQHRVKVSHSEVRSILLRSLLSYPFAGAWERQFADGVSAGKAVA